MNLFTATTYEVITKKTEEKLTKEINRVLSNDVGLSADKLW